MNTKKYPQPNLTTLVNLSRSKCDEKSDFKRDKSHGFREKVKMVKKASKGRARSMVIGATSVINKWPDHLLFCWLASLTFIIFIVGCIVIFSSVGKHCHNSMTDHEKCVLRHTHASKRADTFMKSNMFLHVIVNNEEKFDIEEYKNVLTTALKNHPKYIINIQILFNDLLHYDFKRNSRIKMWQSYHNGINHYTFFDTSSAERDESTGVSFIRMELEPNIHIIQSTLSNFFKHSPLRNTWRNIPTDILPVAIRLLNLWEHGGVSVSWNLFLDKNKLPKKDPASSSRMQRLLEELKRNLSTGREKPQDPFEIKKILLEKMKTDLTDLPVDSYSLALDSSQLYSIYRHFKSQLPNKINLDYISKLKARFMTSEEKAAGSKKLTAEGLIRESVSSIPSSSSYYSDSYSSSSVYDPSSEDGLPRSYESISSEFRLRPERSPEFIRKELMRYVNRKPTDNSQEIEVRMGRTLMSLDYEETSSEYDSEENNSDYTNEKQKNEKSQRGMRNPFEDLQQQQTVSNEFLIGKRNLNSRKNVEIQKIKDELATYSSDQSYSSSSDYNEVSQSSSSESPESMSLEALQKIFGPISEEKHLPLLYIKEKKGYKDNDAFKPLNIFALPNKSNVLLDHSGYYISVQKPCNEFISQLIKLLQNTTDFTSPEAFIRAGTSFYCPGYNLNKCEGLTFIEDDI